MVLAGTDHSSQEFSSTRGQEELEGDMKEQLFFKLGDSLLMGTIL